MTGRSFALYAHIPFCSRKCPYCDFNTYAISRVPEVAYTASLTREIERYSAEGEFSGRPISTIFFGGGTPSIFSAGAIGKVIEAAHSRFGFPNDVEITLEANPSATDREKLSELRHAGVNRVSFGAQSFNPTVLGVLGREHDPEDIERAVDDARSVGFDNVSIDIIYGVPGQTLEMVRADLERAAKTGVDHVSTYNLTIEKGTPFFQRQERGLLALPPEETCAEMLDLVPDVLHSLGYSRYEISNYCRAGRESRHNLSYWNGADYLGLGAGAHSLVVRRNGERPASARRWSNCASPQDYIARCDSEFPISWKEELDNEALSFEFFFLGLRKSAGVSMQEFESSFGAVSSERASTIEDLIREGYLQSDQSHLRLTRRGISVADSVLERLL